MYKWQWIFFLFFLFLGCSVSYDLVQCHLHSNRLFSLELPDTCFINKCIIVCTHTYHVVLRLNSLHMLKMKKNCYEKTTACHQKKFHNPHYHSEQVCEIIISSNDKQRKGIKAFTFSLKFIWLLRVVFSSQQRLNRPAVNAVQWRHSLPENRVVILIGWLSKHSHNYV